MVDIDVNDMLGQIIHEMEPSSLAASEVLNERPIDGIVLIVVMRYEWSTAFVSDRFVISIEIAKMSPTIFINDLPAIEKGIGPCDRCIDQICTFNILILIPWREITDGFRVCIPL